MQSKESHENSPLCCGWKIMTSYGQTGQQRKKIWDAVLCRLALPPIILHFAYKQWVACSLIFSQKMPKITQYDIIVPTEQCSESY